MDDELEQYDENDYIDMSGCTDSEDPENVDR